MVNSEFAQNDSNASSRHLPAFQSIPISIIDEYVFRVRPSFFHVMDEETN